MGPWDNYAAEDPRGQPANWADNGAGEYRYVGPVDPAWNSTALGSGQQPTYVAPGIGGGVPIDPAYYSSENPAYTGGPYTSPSSEYVPYQPGPTVAEQVAASQQPAPPGYGGYDPLSSSYPPAPAPSPLPSISTIGDVSPSAPISGTYGLGTGQSDFGMTTGYPVYQQEYADYQNQLANGTVPTTTDPLPAAGGATTAPTSNAAPGTLYTENVPAAGAVNGMNAYGDASGGYGGGGYSSTYPYPSMPSAGGGFGGGPMPDRQFNPGAFDPFAWAGVGNPMPASGPMRNQILGNQGLPGPAWYPGGPLPQGQAPAPMGPTPSQQRQMVMDGIKVGQQISDAQHEMQQGGPQPMPGLEYVRNRLKLNRPQGY